MAKETAISDLFTNTDHDYVFTILDADEAEAVNISGWALSFMVKRRLSHADADAVIAKATEGDGIVISGIYDADPDVSTQVATVSIHDVDTVDLTARAYQYELKRTDEGSEVVLAYGELTLLQAVHRD